MSSESSISQCLCVTFTIIYLIFAIAPLVVGIVFLSTEEPFERRSRIEEYNLYLYNKIRYNKRALSFNSSRDTFLEPGINFSVSVHSSDLQSPYMTLEEEERGSGFNYPYRDVQLKADDAFEEYMPIYYQNTLDIPTSGYVDAVFIYNNTDHILYSVSQERNPSLELFSRSEIGCNSLKYIYIYCTVIIIIVIQYVKKYVKKKKEIG